MHSSFVTTLFEVNNDSLNQETGDAGNFGKADDFFSEIYQDPTIQAIMITSYALCHIGSIGQAFVIWFERSCQAGHYRTLVNSLASVLLTLVQLD